ncbi:C-type lectin domain containing protein [Aphelenchoides avenae]|nr:C-type lectin domain containing protein [Aphelenchus avenae]KAH7712278.1 C-type lectin domain containing protein [Aphelenchus avenae]
MKVLGMGTQKVRVRNGVNIGLKKVKPVGRMPEWRWQDGSPVNFEEWARGEPSQEPGHDCAQQINNGGSRNKDYGKWRAVPCNAKPAVAVCKKAERTEFTIWRYAKLNQGKRP